MGNTTLPIPLELTLDILHRCGRHGVYNFARTSKANYDISVHLLYKHIDLVIALESEALERHEKYGVYDFVQIVDLPIGFSCPEFFTDPLTSDPTSDIQEALRKFKNIQELHLIIAEENYSKTCPTARILRWVLSDYVSQLSTLFLEIYCSSFHQQEFKDLLTDVSTFKNDPLPNHDKLKTIKTWVSHFQPRRLMSYISPLLSPFVCGLQNIEIRTRCNFNDNVEDGWWVSDGNYTYLKGLESESITSASIEDKQMSSTKFTCQFISKAWPNLVDLDLDLGIDHYMNHYRRLSRLKHLKKLGIMFPYRTWGLQVRANMAEEAEFPATRLCALIPPLQEVSIKYMGGDCSMSQTAVFNCVRREDEDQSIVASVELKELWGEKGDYEDSIGMLRMVDGVKMPEGVSSFRLDDE
ncbi:hypothetical protein TWF506_001907 [Arthrobotrys conoides]|uniref:Uncharacterized protein n=1 Tax=Arthrobotrys conoides TaxID=74498 RepID=A0AAN8S269_9PEZI